ncbi:SDR family NAD(P)-dependent oxidoreductase [Treponema peruense]|uniref:SDR family oxidoreductase n=1 Tax=Treponema peruense TaxID=2787628 RepID=A0A7T3RFI2_9SPIR|nr:SDR family oxidoreductase [Treponema peruense]QQA02117.1 SDR family oxidoreductase [Treponema peruense]
MNILITGGSSGLGKSIVEMAAKENHTVYFTYRNHKENADSICSQYSNSISLNCDFANSKNLKEFLNKIPDFNLDVLVNNAYSGITLGQHFHKTSITEFQEAFQNNILPLISITQKCLETFRKKKSGKIITVLTSALVGTPPMGYSVYAATKAYIAQLVKSWSREYIKLGITSNAVAPDFMETALTEETNDFVKDQIKDGNPLKNILTTDEVAKVVMNLMDASPQLNGVIIPVNAGINIL